MIVSVEGLLDPAAAGITDAHNHVWIDPVAGAEPGAPVLNDFAAVTAGLADYRRAGGGTIVDCQPGGCGRNGRRLAQVAAATGVHVVACTGFHLARYYPKDYWLWSAGVDAARAYFVDELQTGLAETLAANGEEGGQAVRAGFIKLACRARLDEMPAALLEAAAAAALETGAALLVHTEQGAAAEEIIALFTTYGLQPDRVVLCHVDKRPDRGLHRDLAQAGVMLEYDTFFRPKYQPEARVWPLLEWLAAEGYAGQIALGTDLADPAMWPRTGTGPGPAGLPGEIVTHLRAIGCDDLTVRRLAGGNIAARLDR